MTQTMMTSPRNILLSHTTAKTSLAAAVIAAMLCTQKANADNQIKNEFNPVQTGVTSLGIAPDARGASMGVLGAATAPDAPAPLWTPRR